MMNGTRLSSFRVFLFVLFLVVSAFSALRPPLGDPVGDHLRPLVYALAVERETQPEERHLGHDPARDAGAPGRPFELIFERDCADALRRILFVRRVRRVFNRGPRRRVS